MLEQFDRGRMKKVITIVCFMCSIATVKCMIKHNKYACGEKEKVKKQIKISLFPVVSTHPRQKINIFEKLKENIKNDISLHLPFNIFYENIVARGGFQDKEKEESFMNEVFEDYLEGVAHDCTCLKLGLPYNQDEDLIEDSYKDCLLCTKKLVEKGMQRDIIRGYCSYEDIKIVNKINFVHYKKAQKRIEDALSEKDD